MAAVGTSVAVACVPSWSSDHRAPTAMNRGPGRAVRLAHTFVAAGGPITATVTITGAGPAGCLVTLVGRQGAVLAAAHLDDRPMTLRASAPAATPIRLTLAPSHPSDLAWQATVAGVEP